MTDIYTLPNTEAGKRMCAYLVHVLAPRECREYEEEIEGVVVLRLEASGKRVGEGRIAKQMKERKKA